MRNTTKTNYEGWKSKDFAQTSSRNQYYFQQLIVPLKLNNSSNILEISKFPTRIIRRSLHLIIERLVRWIFAPQSKGFLSSNLLAILKNDKK